MTYTTTIISPVARRRLDDLQEEFQALARQLVEDQETDAVAEDLAEEGLL